MRETAVGTSSESEVMPVRCDEALVDTKPYSSQESVLVAEEEGDEPIELPTENDNTLLLSTLAAQYPGTCGLRYRNTETNAMRGIRMTDGKLHPPENKWGNCIYYCVFPKENKRKSNDDMGNTTAKTKRVDSKFHCSDLIVLGLPYKTSERQLKEYFDTFGPAIKSKVKRDPNTGHSKGFGFIRFKNIEFQEKALSQDHILDGCRIFVKPFNVQEGELVDKEARKVFVGGITEDIKGDDLRDYFSAYGAVTNVFIPKTFRAFAFVTFLDPEVAYSLCGEMHVIKGVTVQVSSAARKWDHNRRQGGAGGQGMGGRRGGMQGGGKSAASQGASVSPGNLMGVGNMPMNAALIAAALTQVGWNLAAGWQPNAALGCGPSGQTTAASMAGPQKEADGHAGVEERAKVSRKDGPPGWSSGEDSCSDGKV